MFGIDVSQHQGVIDWEKAKSKIGFAILRLGWIGNKNNHTIDTQFERNYAECKRLGIPVGVYLYNYCNSEETVKQGANWVLERLKGKSLELPVYIDMEDNSIANLGKEKLTNICIAFNTIIEKDGKWAGVYANRNWFNNYLYKEEIKKRYTTWIAHYTNETEKYKGEYDIWQNGSNGQIDGISGRADTNYMYRDLISEIGNKKVSTVTDNIIVEKKEEFEMAKTYKNGSTVEIVYSDSNCTNKIGSLNTYETCECIGIVNGKYIVKYKVNNTNNYKVGFVKYSGGVK